MALGHRRFREYRRLEAEHVVEAERAAFGEEAVITEEAARRVTDNDIGIGARPVTRGPVERLVVAPEQRPRAGDSDTLARHLGTARIVQHEIGGALGVPRCRRRIDQMAQSVVRLLAEAEEEPRREARRAAGMGLRLALVRGSGLGGPAGEAGRRGRSASRAPAAG